MTNPRFRTVLAIAAGVCLPLAHAAEPATTDAKANRLANEQSPYLIQHAYNPVDWYPWGDEAFEKAKAEGKIVLLSVGYSTCHWCHVMNRESFSDPDIAAYLNEHFVCIKVDREERPDVDSVYMNFVQQLTGSGGWPLNVWLTPERKPFFGGTYFPPDNRRGHRGATFPELLVRIQEMWTNDRESMIERSEQIVAALNDAATQNASDGEFDLGTHLIADAVAAFQEAFNERTGAFGTGPNFPSAANLSFLLKSSVVKELPKAQRDEARRIALTSLDAIAAGGIHDHIGGGFHRYTVDGEWKLPHFEKMLYDQATLITAYTHAWQATKNDAYRSIVDSAVQYLLRDMRLPQGGFYSAEDAESYESADAEEKREGAFYVWSDDELAKALGDDSLVAIARSYYSFQENGNAPHGPFSIEQLKGYNTLRIEKTMTDVGQELDRPESEIESKLAQINAALFDARKNRPRPHLDDKIITAWNGLAISALALAGQTFSNPRYIEAAAQAARFIEKNLYHPESRSLVRLYRNSPSTVAAFTDDYAYLIQGLLDLYEADAQPHWLQWANDLQTAQIDLFYDDAQGGFFSFKASDDIVFAQPKDNFDGAIPSANSVSAKNLARLGQYFDNEDFSEKALQSVRLFTAATKDAPMRMPALLDAALFVIKKPIQIVIADQPDKESLAPIVATTLLPNRLILHANAGPSQEFLGKHLEFIRSARPIDGASTAYVCENFVCQLPARSPDALAAQLNGLVE